MCYLIVKIKTSNYNNSIRQFITLLSYQAGYIAGRIFTRMLKIYFTGKVIEGPVSRVNRISKQHKIDSRNSEVINENIFNCL